MYYIVLYCKMIMPSNNLHQNRYFLRDFLIITAVKMVIKVPITI